MTANTTLARLQELLPELFQPVEVKGDPYLRFQLTPEIPALLSMERVQEALLVPTSMISPLPNMPAFTIGMMNARDRVFCVVDLGQLMGLPPMPNNPHNYQVVIINLSTIAPAGIEQSASSSSKYLGLAVLRVKGVARFNTEQLQLSANQPLPECLEPYMMGYFKQAAAQILALDTLAIANSPNLLSNLLVSS